MAGLVGGGLALGRWVRHNPPPPLWMSTSLPPSLSTDCCLCPIGAPVPAVPRCSSPQSKEGPDGKVFDRLFDEAQRKNQEMANHDQTVAQEVGPGGAGGGGGAGRGARRSKSNALVVLQRQRTALWAGG